MKLLTSEGEYHAHFWHHDIGKLSRCPRCNGSTQEVNTYEVCRRCKGRGQVSKKPHFVTEVRVHAGKCVIEGEKDKERCVSTFLKGEAFCHSKLDTFNREEGRSRALDNAMLTRHWARTGDGKRIPILGPDGQQVMTEHLPKPIRNQIWDSYKAAAKLPTSRASRAVAGGV